MLPGVHRVQRQSADGRVSVYWYAWRGGPQILKVGPLPARQVAKAVDLATADAVLRHKGLTSSGHESVTLYGLITRYLAPPSDAPPGAAPLHLAHMSARTLSDRHIYLAYVRQPKAKGGLAELELKALSNPKIRAKLLEWRDSQAATPKSADERLYALSCVLQWAHDKGELPRNPIEDFPRIYRAPDRSEIIWTPDQLELLYRHADKALKDLVQVAVNTGLRLGDLRSLPKSAVGNDAIVFQTGKSNRRRTAVVPITDELRLVLPRITPAPNSLTLLNSSRLKPWLEPGVESAMRRARASALEEAKKRRGPNAKSGLEGLRIHDMRGTAATNFMRWGMDDEEIATLLGWKLDQVKEIRRRYVSGQEIGMAMLRRIKANKAAQDL